MHVVCQTQMLLMVEPENSGHMNKVTKMVGTTEVTSAGWWVA